MMLSSEDIQVKICKTFCQTPWNGFDFDDEICFENGSQPLLITDTVKHWQGSRKEFQKPCGCLNFTQAGVYIRHMQRPYLVIPMSRVLCPGKRSLCHTTKDPHKST